EYLLNRVVVEAWQSGALGSLNINRTDFADMVAPRLVLRRQSTSVATCRHYVRSIARQALTCSSQRGWPGSRARNISSPQASPGGAGVPRLSPVLRGPGTHHSAAILKAACARTRICKMSVSLMRTGPASPQRYQRK